MRNELDLEDRLLSAIQVRQFFAGVSHMWLHRRLQDDPTFPRPIVISSRRYWRLAELRAWTDAHQQDAA